MTLPGREAPAGRAPAALLLAAAMALAPPTAAASPEPALAPLHEALTRLDRLFRAPGGFSAAGFYAGPDGVCVDEGSGAVECKPARPGPLLRILFVDVPSTEGLQPLAVLTLAPGHCVGQRQLLAALPRADAVLPPPIEHRGPDAADARRPSRPLPTTLEFHDASLGTAYALRLGFAERSTGMAAACVARLVVRRLPPPAPARDFIPVGGR